MSKRLMDLATVIITLLAVALGGSRLFEVIRGAPDPYDPVTIEGWREYSKDGHRVGHDDTPVVIVEFSDFQCPFCRSAHADLRSILKERPTEVAMVYRHFPLQGVHDHAVDAALASECAANQGRFEDFHNLLFSQQDSIGVRSWSAMADEAGVHDLDAFRTCRDGNIGAQALANDTLAAHELGLRGTPALLVNNLLVGGNPGRDRLEELVDRALRGNR